MSKADDSVFGKVRKVEDDIKDNALLLVGGAFLVGYLIGRFRKWRK